MCRLLNFLAEPCLSKFQQVPMSSMLDGTHVVGHACPRSASDCKRRTHSLKHPPETVPLRCMCAAVVCTVIGSNRKPVGYNTNDSGTADMLLRTERPHRGGGGELKIQFCLLLDSLQTPLQPRCQWRF